MKQAASYPQPTCFSPSLLPHILYFNKCIFYDIMKQVFSICFCPQGVPGDWNAIPLRHLFLSSEEKVTGTHVNTALEKNQLAVRRKPVFQISIRLEKKHIYFLFNYWIFFRAPRCGGHNYTLKLHHLVLGRLRQSGTLAQSMSIISQSPLLHCQEWAEF